MISKLQNSGVKSTILIQYTCPRKARTLTPEQDEGFFWKNSHTDVHRCAQMCSSKLSGNFLKQCKLKRHAACAFISSFLEHLQEKPTDWQAQSLSCFEVEVCFCFFAVRHELTETQKRHRSPYLTRSMTLRMISNDNKCRVKALQACDLLSPTIKDGISWRPSLMCQSSSGETRRRTHDKTSFGGPAKQQRIKKKELEIYASADIWYRWSRYRP